LGGYITLQKLESDGSLGDFAEGNFILTNHHLVKAVPKKAAPKEGAPKEGAPKEAALKKAAPKKAAPKKAAPKKASMEGPRQTLIDVHPWQTPIELDAPEQSKPIVTLLKPCGCLPESRGPCPYATEAQLLQSKREELVQANVMQTDIDDLDEIIRLYKDVSKVCEDFPEGTLGRVWATSGLRMSRDERRLDWAIIKVTGDMKCGKLTFQLLSK